MTRYGGDGVTRVGRDSHAGTSEVLFTRPCVLTVAVVVAMGVTMTMGMRMGMDVGMGMTVRLKS